MCTKQIIFICHFVCISVQCLVREVTVLNKGSLYQGCVYVSKGGCVPINLLNKMPNLIKKIKKPIIRKKGK